MYWQSTTSSPKRWSQLPAFIVIALKLPLPLDRLSVQAPEPKPYLPLNTSLCGRSLSPFRTQCWRTLRCCVLATGVIVRRRGADDAVGYGRDWRRCLMPRTDVAAISAT